MADAAGSPIIQDFEVGPGFEDLAQLDDWAGWDFSDDGFILDDLIPGAEDDSCNLDALADHANTKGFCSDFGEFEELLVNSSSSASPNNSSNGVGVNSHDAQTPEGTALTDSCSVDNKEALGLTHGFLPETRARGGQDHANRESKRQLRLINNREAAFQSRQRRKSYIQGLESKCQMWENYCNQLQGSIAFVCAENTVLRDELSRCKRQKGSNGVSEPAVLKDSPPLESRSHLTTLVVACHLVGVHCLEWLLAALILLLLGGAVKPRSGNSTNQAEDEYKSSVLRVSITFGEKRPVLEAFPVTSNRALSSCRHRYRRLKELLILSTSSVIVKII